MKNEQTTNNPAIDITVKNHTYKLNASFFILSEIEAKASISNKKRGAHCGDPE